MQALSSDGKAARGAEVSRRLVGYVRVSTDEQAAVGLSLDAQRVRISAYATALGYDLVKVEEDHLSGRLGPNRREGLARALDAVRSKEADGLVVFKLDRLSRKTMDVLELADDARRQRWRLLSVCEPSPLARNDPGLLARSDPPSSSRTMPDSEESYRGGARTITESRAAQITSARLVVSVAACRATALRASLGRCPSPRGAPRGTRTRRYARARRDELAWRENHLTRTRAPIQIEVFLSRAQQDKEVDARVVARQTPNTKQASSRNLRRSAGIFS